MRWAPVTSTGFSPNGIPADISADSVMDSAGSTTSPTTTPTPVPVANPAPRGGHYCHARRQRVTGPAALYGLDGTRFRCWAAGGPVFSAAGDAALGVVLAAGARCRAAATGGLGSGPVRPGGEVRAAVGHRRAGRATNPAAHWGFADVRAPRPGATCAHRWRPSRPRRPDPVDRLDDDLAPQHWIAVTPPRILQLRTLQDVVGSADPVLLDWLVGLAFPCQRPFGTRTVWWKYRSGGSCRIALARSRIRR